MTQPPTEPTLTLALPRSVAYLFPTLLRKLPLEQAEQPYRLVMEQLEEQELALARAEREAIVKAALAEREARLGAEP